MSLEVKSLEFGEFLLDLEEKILLRNGERLPINPKTYHLLVVLIQNHGHTVEKEQLMEALWADAFVEDANLAFTVSLLRKTLGDDAQNPRFIETIPRRGYRFIGQLGTVKNKPETDIPLETIPGPRPPRRVVLTTVSVLVLIALFGAGFAWLISDARPTESRGTLVERTRDGKITNAVVTPDGRHIVFSRKEGIGEALWRKEINSEDQTQLVPAQAVEYTGLSVSPASDFAYFSVFAANDAVATLSRISLAGGQPESLSDIAADVSVTFSPDGERIAFTENVSSVNETYLKTANADGSNQRTIITTKGPNRDLPIFRASPVAWSPDGKTIAAAIRESDENGSVYKVLLVDPETGSQSALNDAQWNNVVNIAWLSDGELVLIDSEPSSSNKSIWRVSVGSGKRTKLSDERIGFDWLSTSGGKIYTVKKKTHSGLFVADVEESSRTIRPKQIYADTNPIDTVAWNRNGEILFNSGESGKNEVWRVNRDGTSPQQITTDSGLQGSLTVSPIDDELVFSANRNRRVVLVSTDPSGRDLRQITDGPYDANPSISADGRSVVFQRGTMKPTLWRLSLDQDRRATQITGYFSQNPRHSPDGSLISFHFMDFGESGPKWKLGLIDSVTRRVVNKLEFPVAISNRETAWNPLTGIATMAFGEGDGAGFLLISPLTGAYNTITGVGGGAITSFAWSPDGHTLAFVQKHETTDVVELTVY